MILRPPPQPRLFGSPQPFLLELYDADSLRHYGTVRGTDEPGRLLAVEKRRREAAARERDTTLSDFIRTMALGAARAQSSDRGRELTELRDDGSYRPR